MLASGRRQLRRTEPSVDPTTLAAELHPLLVQRYGPGVEIHLDHLDVVERRRAVSVGVPVRVRGVPTRLQVTIPRPGAEPTVDRARQQERIQHSAVLERAFAGTGHLVVGMVGHLPTLDAIVTEHVEADPLRELLVQASDRSGPPSIVMEEVYRRLGQWLGHYYVQVGQAQILRATPAQLLAFAEFELDRLVELTDAIDHDRLRRRVDGLLMGLATTDVVFAHPHGKLQAGTVLITADGRPTVVGPITGGDRWAPLVFDLATLLVDPIITRRQWMWHLPAVEDHTIGRWNYVLLANILPPEFQDPNLVELGCLIAVLHKWRYVLEELSAQPRMGRLRRPLDAWVRLGFERLCLDRDRLGRLVDRPR